MHCDMCAKQGTVIAKVEGAQLHVCDSCARFGTVLRRIAQPVKRNEERPRELKEELIEQVRPDTAKLLRLHREKLQLNQEQFAAKLQLRASTYNHYESGASLPDIATARKLEHVLNVPLVVHVKVAASSEVHEPSRGMTMGDFLKK